MKKFLGSLKGKIISAVALVGVIGAVVLLVIPKNKGYRTIAVNEVNGTALVKHDSSESEAYAGQHLKSGDDVRVQTVSDMTLLIDNDMYMYAEPETHFWLEANGKAGSGKTLIKQDSGAQLYRIDHKLSDSESFEVETPNATMSVRGTVFRVTVYEEAGIKYTLVEVFEGEVYVEVLMENGNYTGEIGTLTAGDSALIWSDPTFSEFVKGDDGSYTHEIEYRNIPQKTAQVLGTYIDEGRELSIEKNLLFDYVKLSEHEFNTTKDSVPATCLEDGYEVLICSVCGEESEQIILPKIEHEYEYEDHPGEYCEEDGYRIATCVVCGDSYEEVLPAIGHVYNEDDAVVVEATCTKNGSITGVCTVCGKEEKTVIAATGHNYTTKTEAANCTKDGRVIHTCSVCGTENVESIAATGHNYTETTVAATCFADGKTKKTCKDCGYVEETVIASSGHNYVDTTVEATCDKDGKVTHTCTLCGDVQEEILSATGHDMEDRSTPATCLESGVNRKVCKKCGYEVTSAAAPLGHLYSSWSMLNQRQCESYCARCGNYTYANHDRPEDIAGAITGPCSRCGFQ